MINVLLSCCSLVYYFLCSRLHILWVHSISPPYMICFPFGRKNTEPIVWNLNYVVFICRFWYWTCFNSKRPGLFLFLPERANPIALVAFAHQDGVNKLECIIYWMVIPKNKVEHNWNHSILGWVLDINQPNSGVHHRSPACAKQPSKGETYRTLGRAHETIGFKVYFGNLWYVNVIYCDWKFSLVVSANTILTVTCLDVNLKPMKPHGPPVPHRISTCCTCHADHWVWTVFRGGKMFGHHWTRGIYYYHMFLQVHTINFLMHSFLIVNNKNLTGLL